MEARISCVRNINSKRPYTRAVALSFELKVESVNYILLAVLCYPRSQCVANRSWVWISLFLCCIPLFPFYILKLPQRHFLIPAHHGSHRITTLLHIRGQVPRPQEPCTGRRQHLLCPELRGCRLASAWPTFQMIWYAQVYMVNGRANQPSLIATFDFPANRLF